MCPTYSSDCGTLTAELNFSGDNSSFSQNFITSNVVCVYKITSTSFVSNAVELEVKSATNLAIDVYTSSSSNKYSHKGSMEDEDKKTVDLDRTTDVYIVVEPESGTNRLDIEFTSVYRESTLSAGAIIGIVLGSVICFALIIGGVVFGIIF